MEKLKARVVKDRADYNRASSAFISHVRSYKELDLKFIFKFMKLEPSDLAKAFSLPKVPHVKEFPNIAREEVEDAEEEKKEFRVTDIPFRNKN